MEITKEKVLKALSYVDDPDLGKDLVTLNMIKDVEIGENEVAFSVELTTPACPMKETIQKACVNAIHHFIGKDVKVKIDMTSNVTSKRNGTKTEDVLPGVKNIIAVASGKGGVGKSTVAVNLALGLVKKGAKVGLIDADIYGPSIPTMLGLKGKRPEVVQENGKNYLLPLEVHGLKTLSIGFLVDDAKAVVWRGPMVSSALKQFVTECRWGELDYLIYDLPPGTGDIHLSLVQTVPVTGSVIVTTPQEVSLSDVRKAVGMFKMDPIKVPVLGLVENMSFFTPPDMPDKKYYIFGKGGGKELAEELGTPLLGQIPIVEKVREGGDAGKPVVLDPKEPASGAFLELAQNVAQQVAIRNSSFEPTKKVEIKT